MTPEQERQIMAKLNQLGQGELARIFSSERAFATWAAGFLGGSVVNYLLNQHGWPWVEKKLRGMVGGRR